MQEVTVIGGGAAGMMAAYAAARNGCRVTLLEKNEKLGKKLYITGKGRCNVTNACDFDRFLSNIVTNQKFMYSSLRSFFHPELCALLESAGCPLKTERGERVFPVSDHASDITKALTLLLKRAQVEICLRQEVTELQKTEAGDFLLSVTDHTKDDWKLPGRAGAGRHGKAPLPARVGTVKLRKHRADAVIVCTGGLSYATTGSTGDGYRFAENFGLCCKTPCPSLVPLTLAESDAREMQGLSLKNVSLRIAALCAPQKTLFFEQGELLFTHFGISGPLVLSASALLSGRLAKGEKFVLEIDLKPALSEEKLDERILRDFAEMKNMNLGNAVAKLLPSAMRPVILKRCGLPAEKKVHEVTKEERRRLLSAIKKLSFTVTGTRGFPEAVVTQGGVSVSEINPKTMEAKKVPGLYFAGEVLDIDAMTGGFNLQLAFSTGHAAGSSLFHGPEQA